ncbi:diguanylate cyclase [Vibrio variabilis]|uniref:Diguanylate cyclase n=3 Tax=Vibrio TaxID=662 RepID=A0ABR4Y6X1_9VIBR|nr:sensor domain-containing diguanylate cyclase [Vibrio variabilis]KHA59218.1 diguanylate cyclase [Vibrio variabilis]
MEEHETTIAKLKDRIAELEENNRRLEEKLNAALDGTGLCLWEQHVPTGQLRIFNMEWGKMLGYQPHELEATVEVWKSKLHPDDYDLAVGAFEAHLRGEADAYQVVHRMLHKDGTHSWVSDRGRIVEYDDNGSPLRIMGTHIDITNEKRYEEELARLASEDPLTGLFNRQALTSHFADYAKRYPHRPSALIFIDLDDFKTVNDHLGHKAGDLVLMQISAWLKDFAPKDAFIARLGGDEFVLLCHEDSPQSIDRFTDDLLSQSQQPIQLDNGSAKVGFSIGICHFTPQSYDFEALYVASDQAMYSIKQNGKNGVARIHL